jgi:hypothetical protein
MATHEVDLIRDAIASTEKEIFGEAWGTEDPVQDESGDRTNEQMGEGLEGEHVPAEDDGSEGDDESPDDEATAEGEETEAEDAEAEDAEGEDGDEAEQSEPEDAATEAAAPELPPEGRVPSGRLREQTDRAERAEGRVDVLLQERDAERQRYERDIAELRTQMNTVLATVQGAQGHAPQPPPAPDLPPDQFENPQGYTEWMIQRQERSNAQTRQLLQTMRFQNSMDIARAVHADKFGKAWDAVNKLDAKNPEELAVAQKIYNATDPGGELLKWHARQEALRVVGDDPEKYRQTVTNEVREAMKNDPEFRKQFIDELRAEASGERSSKPARHITRLPKSLNGATGQGSIREKADPDLYDNSEQSVWNSAWR